MGRGNQKIKLSYGDSLRARKDIIPKELLSDFISQGMSQRQISESLGKSQGSVRHWLKKYNLKTDYVINKTAPIRLGNQYFKTCKIHGFGPCTPYGENKKPRCFKCNELKFQKDNLKRKAFKIELLKLAGGAKCSRCGYQKNTRAFHFHHLDNKKFSISDFQSKKLGKLEKETLYKEAKKCIVLCANCHQEEHTTGGQQNDLTFHFSNREHMTGYIRKMTAIKFLGGACILCQNTNIKHLSFHHLYPKDAYYSKERKLYNLTNNFFKSKFSTVQSELSKTVILCHNCHAEVEDNQHSEEEKNWKQNYPHTVLEEKEYLKEVDNLKNIIFQSTVYYKDNKIN